MTMGVAAILGMGLMAMPPVVTTLSADNPSDLAGCLAEEVFQGHVEELAAADWRALDRKWIMERWPNLDFSAREPSSNEVLGFEQRGRVINHEVQCGITYLFAGAALAREPDGAAPKDAFYLRSVTMRQADRSRERVLALAQWVIDATGAPPGAKGTWSARLDAGDRRPVLFDVEYAWPSARYRQLLLVKVLQADGTFVLEAIWNVEIQ